MKYIKTILGLSRSLSEKRITPSLMEGGVADSDNLSPELSFRILSPKSSVNQVGDVLTLQTKHNRMHFKKADGREVFWKRDLGLHKGRALYEIYLPESPGWNDQHAFNKEELEQVQKEIRHGLYVLGAHGVIFQSKAYMDWLMQPIEFETVQ